MADQQRQVEASTGLRPSLIRRARATLVFERLWPVAVAIACLVALFLTVSWLGLWLVVPASVRMLGVAAFGIAGLVVLVLGSRAALPGRSDVLARLDRDSGLPHRPISAAEDGLANPAGDPATPALWEMHRRRLQATLARVKVAPPSPRLVERDAFALRAGVLVALVAAGFVAGPEQYGRVAAALAWNRPETVAGLRLDAWIDPPGYTGKPPLVLLGAKTLPGGSDVVAIRAPVGSTVVVRAAGEGRVEVTGDGGLKPAAAQPEKDAAPRTPEIRTIDRRFTLSRDGTLRIEHDGAPTTTFAITAIPDLPPRIALAGGPKPSARGTLDLRYTIEDDYGVVGAEAHFSNPIVRGHTVTGRQLAEPPRGVLALPALPGGLGEGKTTLDLSDHPWAGAVVTLTLSTRDEGGNVGESTPVTLTLPAKPFNNPLAQALVEQRRDLLLDPDGRAGVATALDALQIAPEAFGVPPAVYLGLHIAQVRLAGAHTDADLVGVADFLWAMALRLENGDLTKTEQDLRAAQKALRDALDRGAAPDDIKRLTEALRQQMDKFLSEMQQQQQRDQANNQAAPDRNSRTVTDKQLKSMMDRMEDAARKGDMAEAQRLLDQLNAIMENLKTAKRGNAQQSEANRQMNRSMSALNQMMRDQGDVRDKTFQEDQDQAGDEQGGQGEKPQDQGDDQSADGQDGGQQPGGQQNSGPQPGGQQPGRSGKGKPGYKGLQGRQQTLQGQLDALQQQLRGLGMKGEQGFADAQQAMKDAQDALGKGDGQSAVEAQGRALQGLQKGAGGLQQQMAQSGQQGERAEGQGGEQDSDDPPAGEDLDPLGRPRQGRGYAQSRNLDVSGGLAARAQQVLQELRRRLGDPTRTQDEQDYLERLLQRY